jgi:hypothetical protein
MVELLFPLTLREDMKDVFIHPRGLGLRGVWMVRRTSPVHVFILSDLHVSVKGGAVSKRTFNLSITYHLSK